MTRSPDSLIPSGAGQPALEKRDDKAFKCRQEGQANLWAATAVNVVSASLPPPAIKPIQLELIPGRACLCKAKPATDRKLALGGADTVSYVGDSSWWSPEAHRRLSAQRHQGTWILAYAGMTVKCLREAISKGRARKIKAAAWAAAVQGGLRPQLSRRHASGSIADGGAESPALSPIEGDTIFGDSSSPA
jgi:hypothetical protein